MRIVEAISLGLILMMIISGAIFSGKMFRKGPVYVPEAEMMAEWHEMERLAEEFPYRGGHEQR